MRVTLADARRLAVGNGELVRAALMPAPAPADADGIALTIYRWANGLLAAGMKPRIRVKARSEPCQTTDIAVALPWARVIRQVEASGQVTAHDIAIMLESDRPAAERLRSHMGLYLFHDLRRKALDGAIPARLFLLAARGG